MNKYSPRLHENLRPDEVDAYLKSSFRTMALFEFFADTRRPASIGELSKSLNMPQSSVSSLVKSLTDSGYLKRNNRSRTYSPTIRLAFLTKWMTDDRPEINFLTSLLKSLSKEFEETFVIAMRNGIYSQYILAERFEESTQEHVTTGSIRPLVCSATGWAMLSADNDSEIDKIIRRTQHETDNTYWKSTAETAQQNISQTRVNGYSFSEGPSSKGTSGVALAIPTKKETFEFSIAAAGTTSSLKRKQMEIGHRLISIKKTFSKDLSNQLSRVI